MTSTQNKNSKGRIVWREVKGNTRIIRKHDNFNVHKSEKELTGTQRHKQTNILTNREEKIIIDIIEKLLECKTNIDELFNDERWQNELENKFRNDELEIEKKKLSMLFKTYNSGK